MTKKASPTEYFAAADAKEIGSALMERVERWRAHLKDSARVALIRKSNAMSRGADVEGGVVSWAIGEAGEAGETLTSMENHFRSIGANIVNRVTAQRPAIQCKAANTDKRSLAQTMLADGLVDFHLSEQGLERLLRKAAWNSWFLSEAFVEWGWDVHAGEEEGPDIGALEAAMAAQEAGEEVPPVPVLKKGEPKHWHLGPLEVVRDEWASSFETCRWLITIKWESKFELAGRFPEPKLAERIKALEQTQGQDFRLMWGKREVETDLVPLFTFYHDRSAAIPGGRMVQFLADDIVLFDGELPYRRMPVARIAPDELEGTPFGWTPQFDLLGPQAAINGIDSAIITNQLGRGIGNMLEPRGANIDVQAFSGSMNVIKYDGTVAPSALEWPQTPQELPEQKDKKIASMEIIAGTNSTFRGNPSEQVGKDASGAKLVFLAETASVNLSGFEKSWADLNRDVALHGVIHLYRDFGGSVQRLARIAGKANGYLVKEYTAEDIQEIDRVKVDIGNPALRTVTGRMAVADRAVEMGVIQKGTADALQKYIHILKEGTDGPLFEVEQASLMRIRGENEALMEGGLHNALLTDPHWKEIPEHLSLLDNPALREPTPENQQLQAAILAAVQQHIDLLTQMPPGLVLMRGGPDALAIWQAMQGVPGMTPMPAPGQESQTPPPAPGDLSSTMNPEGSKGEMPGMPSMPKNPATGESAAPMGAPLQ